jgi:hypothetical protein
MQVGPYLRVIPRDLFNEANLLKCLGLLTLALEQHQGHWASFAIQDDSVSHFEIGQDPSDGSIEVTNMPFMIGGFRYRLYRPLNSRMDFPLYCLRMGDMHSDQHDCLTDPVHVFNREGKLSRAMKGLLGLPQRENER